MKCVAFHYCSGGDEMSHENIKLLDQRYNKYLNIVFSEVIYCNSVTGENEKVDTLQN